MRKRARVTLLVQLYRYTVQNGRHGGANDVLSRQLGAGLPSPTGTAWSVAGGEGTDPVIFRTG